MSRLPSWGGGGPPKSRPAFPAWTLPSPTSLVQTETSGRGVGGGSGLVAACFCHLLAPSLLSGPRSWAPQRIPAPGTPARGGPQGLTLPLDVLPDRCELGPGPRC